MAGVYHRATNSGESSKQWVAYSVAASAPASNPATAPAMGGDLGAPARNAASSATSGAIDSRGTAIRQMRELLPIARAYH